MIEPTPSDAHKRPSVEVFNAEGVLVERSYGKTNEELLEDHKNGKCGFLCDFCYREAMASIGEPYE